MGLKQKVTVQNPKGSFTQAMRTGIKPAKINVKQNNSTFFLESALIPFNEIIFAVEVENDSDGAFWKEYGIHTLS